MTVKDLLYNVEVAPPTFVWDRIATTLDNQSTGIKNKLYHINAQVNNKFWINIEKQLNINQPVKHQLYNITQQAPSNTWANIEAQLNNTQNKVKPLAITYKNKSYKTTILKAAAGLALLLTAGYFINNYSGNKTAAVNIVKNNNTNNNIIVTPNTTTPNVAVQKQVENNTTPPQKQINKLNNPQVATNVGSKNSTDVANNTPKRAQQNLIINVPNSPQLVLKPGTAITPDITLIDAVGDQVMVAGPNGSNFSLSSSLVSKLYLSFNAGNRNDKELIDVRIEEAAIWKAKYFAWKQTFDDKILSSTSMLALIEQLAELK